MEFCGDSKISGWSGNFESSECIDVVKVEYYWQYSKVFSLSIFSNKNYQDFAIKNSGNCQKTRYKWHTVFDSFYSIILSTILQQISGCHGNQYQLWYLANMPITSEMSIFYNEKHIHVYLSVWVLNIRFVLDIIIITCKNPTIWLRSSVSKH